MKQTLYFLLLLVLITTPLFAQYNEKQILSQQASQFMVTRQYDRAEEVYLEILEKYPNDANTIHQLMQLYMTLSNKEKAEEHLNRYQRFLADNTQMEMRIQLFLMQGKAQDAQRLTESYLELYGQHSSRYRQIASYYERYRYYEEAIELYTEARALFGEALFSLEIGNAAMKVQRYHEATEHYLNYIAAGTGVNYYVKNQITAMLKRDESILQKIKEASDQGGSEVITELYGASLIELGRFDEALEIYKRLFPSHTRNFAMQQRKLGNLDLAKRAYEHLETTAEQPLQKLNYGFDIAMLYLEQSQHESCSDKLNELLADEYWNKHTNNKRSGTYTSLRRLKAENDMALGRDFSEVIAWLSETKSFLSRAQDIQEIDLAIAKINILSEDYPAAETALKRISMPIFAEDKAYLGFLLEFFQNNLERADEIMHSFLISHSDSEYANDIVYLNMLAINMNEKQSKSFADSIRKLQLYKEEGIDGLSSLFDETRDEELLILAVEWALRMGEKERAAELLEHEFEDELSADYAQYFRLTLMSDRQEEQEFARQYLKLRPNSIFSPRFRQSLTHGVDLHLNI